MFYSIFIITIIVGYHAALTSAELADKPSSTFPPEVIVAFSGTCDSESSECVSGDKICTKIMERVQKAIGETQCAIMNCSIKVSQGATFDGWMSLNGHVLDSSYNNRDAFPQTFKQMVNHKTDSECAISLTSAEVTKDPESTLTVTAMLPYSTEQKVPEAKCLDPETQQKHDELCKNITKAIFASVQHAEECSLYCGVDHEEATESLHSIYASVFFNSTLAKQTGLYVKEIDFNNKIDKALEALGISWASSFLTGFGVADEFPIYEQGRIYLDGKSATFNADLEFTFTSYYQRIVKCVIEDNALRIGGRAGMRLYSLYNVSGGVGYTLLIRMSKERAAEEEIPTDAKETVEHFKKHWPVIYYDPIKCVGNVTFTTDPIPVFTDQETVSTESVPVSAESDPIPDEPLSYS